MSEPQEPVKTNLVLLLLLWGFVGIPLVWGFVETFWKSMQLFK